MRISTREFAHRALRRMRTFRFVEDLPADWLAGLGAAVAPDDSVVGGYDPTFDAGTTESDRPCRVLVTAQAVMYPSDAGIVRILYGSMQSIDAGIPKGSELEGQLIIRTHDGGVFELRVTGRRGHLADVWPFLTFLLN